MRIMTVVGTRPEIIRLSRLITLLDQVCDHCLVFTGQNDDPNLSDIFFDELGIRRPDIFLGSDNSSTGASIGSIIQGTENAIRTFEPDGIIVLGDTNSAFSLVMARRMGVVSYHLEAGNRSFDPNVPEEINRKLIDHTADYNLPYNDYSLANLLSEGLHSSDICVSGSPLFEVLTHYHSQIVSSQILEKLGLHEKGYLLASIHRQENVDSKARLASILEGLEEASQRTGKEVYLSLHPRTGGRISRFGLDLPQHVHPMTPLSFFDYTSLQKSSFAVISDSGTISEEAAFFGFPAVSPRAAFERPEGLESAKVILCQPNSIADSLSLAVDLGLNSLTPRGYVQPYFSKVVVQFVVSTIGTHHSRKALRPLDL